MDLLHKLLLKVKLLVNMVNIYSWLSIHIHKHMTKLMVEIDDDLNKQFRDAILATKGWNKGVIKEAFREAIEGWIRNSKQSKK